jgi:hypothetical protein
MRGLRVDDMPAPLQFRLQTLFLALVPLALILTGLGMGYRATARALRAEADLHRTYETISLVQQFVSEQSRWPCSWHELQELATAKGISPESLAAFEERVFVGLQADPKEIAKQESMSFTAIAPNSQFRYEYRDDHRIHGLQAEIRRMILGERTDEEAKKSNRQLRQTRSESLVANFQPIEPRPQIAERAQETSHHSKTPPATQR